jgi:hypothetical protein
MRVRTHKHAPHYQLTAGKLINQRQVESDDQFTCYLSFDRHAICHQSPMQAGSLVSLRCHLDSLQQRSPSSCSSSVQTRFEPHRACTATLLTSNAKKARCSKQMSEKREGTRKDLRAHVTFDESRQKHSPRDRYLLHRRHPSQWCRCVSSADLPAHQTACDDLAPIRSTSKHVRASVGKKSVNKRPLAHTTNQKLAVGRGFVDELF